MWNNKPIRIYAIVNTPNNPYLLYEWLYRLYQFKELEEKI